MLRSTVVIPWHKDAAELARAVASVLGQDDADFEIIVVANGVTDADIMAAEAVTADPRYRVVRRAEAGVSAARNHGAWLATGELIFFLDADDVFHSGKLTRFHAAYRKHPFHVAFSRGRRVRSNGASWAWPAGHWDGRRPAADFFFCDGCTISASAIVIAKAARDRIGFQDGLAIYEDPDLIIRAEHLGLDVVMLPDELYDWNDTRSLGRLSRAPNWDVRLAWIASTPPNVSERARAAFRARCVGQLMFPRAPLECLRYVAAARRLDAISRRDALLFVVRGLLPERLRERLLEWHHLRRGGAATGRAQPGAIGAEVDTAGAIGRAPP